MKRFLVLILMLVFVGIVQAVPTVISTFAQKRPVGVDNTIAQPSNLVTDQFAWTVVGTGSYGNEPNDPCITERTYSAMLALVKNGDSKITIVAPLPASWNGVRFECIGATDNCDVNYIVYSGCLGRDTNCSLRKVAKLSFRVGKQVSSTTGYLMADTLTVITYAYNGSILTVSPVDDTVAECKWDLQGDDVLVTVPQVSNCDSKLIAKGY